MVAAQDVIDLAVEALLLAATLAVPVVGAAIVSALVSAALQAVTKVSDPLLSLPARLALTAAAVIVAAPWIAARAAAFAERAWGMLQAIHV